MTTPLILAAICLLLQATYAGAEVALLAVDRAKLEERAEAKDRGAKRILDVLAYEDRLIGTSLIGVNLWLVLGSASVLYGARGLSPAQPAFWVPVVLYVIATVAFAEVVPRRVGRHYALALSGPAASLLRWSEAPFAPLLGLVSVWASLLRRWIRAERRAPMTREEILRLLHTEAVPGETIPEEHRMIRRVFAITQTTAVECMTPLVDVDAVEGETPIRDAVALAVRTGRTRLPVYGERIDHIIGFVHATGLLFGNAPEAPIRNLIRPVRYVPETKRVDELLQDLRRDREHFVVVVDEYGGSIGILTIEDILEELIGEIQDERDEEDGIRQLSEQEWRVPARAEIDALEQAVGRRVPPGDYETVAGLILSVIGRIPRTGETIPIGELVFRIEEANERAIQTVIVRPTESTKVPAPARRVRP
jgi:putative hemolysin